MTTHEPNVQSYPSVTSISRTTPVAHLPHRCMICDQTIEPGAKHHRWVYRLNDAMDRSKSVRAVRFHDKCPPVCEATRGDY